MSIEIKSLSNATPLKDGSLAAAVDAFNIIPTANDVYDIYTAPNNETTKRTALVKSIRLANVKSQTVNISLYFNRPDSNGMSRRRRLMPESLPLSAGATYIDDGEITMEPGDKLQLKAGSPNAIEYIISGVERDVT